MLTNIILDGELGKKFGRSWQLSVNSPSQAIKLIEANKSGIVRWIRSNLGKFSHYRVTCRYEDGTQECLNDDNYVMNRRATEIRFTPMIVGSGGGNSSSGIGAIVIGLIIIVAAVFTYGAALAALPGVLAGVALVAQGVTTLLTSVPDADSSDGQLERKDGTSYYFDGPVNTTSQGVPVQLIYGDEVLVGSHPISVSFTVDEETI